MLQLKSVITNSLPNCRVVFLQPTAREDNEKGALTLHHLNKHFSELNLDVLNNSNIRVKHASQKGLHLNPNENSSLALNFIHKIRVVWWSSEHLNVPTKPYISPSESLNKNIYIYAI